MGNRSDGPCRWFTVLHRQRSILRHGWAVQAMVLLLRRTHAATTERRSVWKRPVCSKCLRATHFDHQYVRAGSLHPRFAHSLGIPSNLVLTFWAYSGATCTPCPAETYSSTTGASQQFPSAYTVLSRARRSRMQVTLRAVTRYRGDCAQPAAIRQLADSRKLKPASSFVVG